MSGRRRRPPFTLEELKKKKFLVGGATWFDVEDITVIARPDIEIPVPRTADLMQIRWDLFVSDDGADMSLEWKIDGIWYTQDVTHKNISESSGATYVGFTASTLNAVGSAAGENACQTLLLYNLLSETLYPTALLSGGYIHQFGAVAMSQGALARKTAGNIEAIRIAPDTGTLSGTVSTTYARAF